MIEIQNSKGQYLELYPDTTLEQELNSWLISEDDTLLGSWSFPFRFPLTPSNQSFISHKHRFEASNFTGISVAMSIDGLPWGPAILNFRIKNDEADAYLVFDQSEVAVQLRTKSISDIVAEDTFQVATDPTTLPAAMTRTVDPLTNPWPFVFAPVYNPKATDAKRMEDEGPETRFFRHRDYINEYRLGFVGDMQTEKVQGTNETITVYGSPVVPFFYLWWVIKRVCEALGFTADGSWYHDPDVRALVMYNNMATSVEYNFGFGVSVYARYHVWSMKLNEFFKFLRTDLGVGVFFNSATQSVIFRSFEELKSQRPTLDLSEQLLSGHTIDPIRQGGYTLQFASLRGIDKENAQPTPYTIGLGETQVSMKLSTLAMAIQKRNLLLLKVNMMVPTDDTPIQTIDTRYAGLGQYTLELPTHPPILMSYLGMQPDQLGFPYPMLSSIPRNYRQTTVGNLATHPDEPNSIFHRWVRPYYEFRAFSKPITQTFRLKIGQAKSARLWEPVLTQSPEFLKLPCLIQSLTTRWPAEEGLLTTEATLWPILIPSDYTPSVPSGIWVKIELYDLGSIVPTIRAYSITFKFFYDQAGTMPAVADRLVIHYQYQTKGFDSEAGQTKTETVRKAARVQNPGTELLAEVYFQAFASDDPAAQVAYPDQYYAIPNTLRILPGAGYRIG
ncbi:hypothetical protein [Runella zeae]|uniref:hypothetical protein n=1 Tax=Runella zeae TaxID=94255 RepID=UPI00040D2265|nr:hypothetical protein [Runella zeae]